MKTKLLCLGLFLFLITYVLSAQADSTYTFNVKNVKVTTGKFYQLTFLGMSPVSGKLIAANKNTLLMMVQNRMQEFLIEDIISLKEVDADNIVYTTSSSPSAGYKPQFSLSAGYSQRYMELNNYSYYYSEEYDGFSGFNIQGDMLVKTSDYFGFRVDLNYIHTFGKEINNGESYYNPYDSSTNTYDYEYVDLNFITLKSGILFGSLGRDTPFNFYLYLGLGLGYKFSSGDIQYNHTTKRNVTTTNEYYFNSGNEFALGAHGSIRLIYKISPKYSLFAEPSFQYWAANVERIINVNGGITFHL